MSDIDFSDTIAHWEPLTRPRAKDLEDTRKQLHWAAQLASAVGTTLNPARPDDSHTNLEWSASARGLVSQASPGPVLVDPSWGNMGTLVNARASFGMSLLLNGQVFVVGGETSGFPMATAERYDPISGVWAAATPLPSGPRSWPVATTLLNGDVLVTGGWTGIQSLFDADVYVTSTNSWTSKPGMGLERAGHTAVRLNDGRVLVCGGAGGSIPSLTEPEGGSDQAQDPGPVNAAPFGGSSGFGGLDDCEIYDPSFNGGAFTVRMPPT